MISLYVIGVIVCAFFISCLYYQWKFRSLNQLPGPKIWPIIGNLLEFNIDTKYAIDKLHEIAKKFGPIMRLWMGPYSAYVIISDVDLIETILSSPKYIQKGTDYKLVKSWVGTGIFSNLDAALWHKRRKILYPAFHFKILEDYIPIFYRNSRLTIDEFSQYVNGKNKVFDAMPILTKHSLRVILETAMDVKNIPDETLMNFSETVEEAIWIFVNRAFSITRSDLIFSLTKNCQELKKMIRIIRGFSHQVLKEKQLQSKQVKQRVVDEFGMKKKRSFIDIVLEGVVDGKPLTDEEIVDEVSTFIFAGHDTVGTTLTYALHALANNPEVQQKCYEEIQTTFGNNKEKIPSWNDLQNMKYLEASLKESIRIYTTVPWFIRELTDDIRHKNYVIPKGTQTLIFNYALCRDEKHFPQHEKFIPERFLDVDKRKHPFSYLAFSAGPRNCIGQKFAWVWMKIFMSSFLQKYEVLPSGPGYDIVFVQKMVMKPLNGVHIKVRPRQY